MLGLREGITACLFDFDGALNQTAKVHAAVRKEMFDAYLRSRAEREGLRGKRAPDTFLAGARALGATPEQSAVFEEA